MERVIKFRAWDKFNGEMLKPEDSGGQTKDLSWFFDQYENLKEGENNPILMQFTGLKDKNEVEIYEGDIVKGVSHTLIVDNFKDCSYTETGTDGSRVYKRVYRNYGSEIVFCNGEYGFKFKDSIKDFYMAKVDKKNWEVIGNIHQNPELLNK